MTALRTMALLLVIELLRSMATILTRGNAIMTRDDSIMIVPQGADPADCHCCHDEPDCYDSACNNCEGGTTPDCYTVTFADIAPCSECTGPGVAWAGSGESIRWTFINGFNPNGTFHVPRSSGCNYQLIIPDAIQIDTWVNETCSGDPLITRFQQVFITISKQSPTSMRVTMVGWAQSPQAPVPASTIFRAQSPGITTAEGYCGSMAGSNEIQEDFDCFEITGGGLPTWVIAQDGTVTLTPCCPEEEVEE